MEWINVKDKLPRPNKLVLIYTPGFYLNIRVSEYSCGYGEDDDEWYEEWLWLPEGSTVTHWMPLPEPPEILNADHRKQRGRTAPNRA